MTVFELENGVDEHFGDETKLTREQAKIVGDFRGLVWELQEAERRANEKAAQDFVRG